MNGDLLKKGVFILRKILTLNLVFYNIFIVLLLGHLSYQKTFELRQSLLAWDEEGSEELY